jgi:hypothetical protein
MKACSFDACLVMFVKTKEGSALMGANSKTREIPAVRPSQSIKCPASETEIGGQACGHAPACLVKVEFSQP